MLSVGTHDSLLFRYKCVLILGIWGYCSRCCFGYFCWWTMLLPIGSLMKVMVCPRLATLVASCDARAADVAVCMPRILEVYSWVLLVAAQWRLITYV